MATKEVSGRNAKNIFSKKMCTIPTEEKSGSIIEHQNKNGNESSELDRKKEVFFKSV